jgi:hypothetical protein
MTPRKAVKKPKNKAAQALGRLGGSKNSLAQHAARQRNARLAGRPRRICVHCRQPVKGGHVDRTLDETCGRHGWRWDRAGREWPAPANRDRDALDLIAALVRDSEWIRTRHADWAPQLVEAIREAVQGTGRTIIEPEVASGE